MTKEDFERQYALRCGFTVELLKELGLEALPCDCDYVQCEGWIMGFKFYEKMMAAVTEMTEDRCQFCGKVLGFGLPMFHVGVCEACADRKVS